MLPRLALTCALAAFVSPAAVSAQAQPRENDGVAPAHVAHVEGTASLEREGRADTSPLNMPLLSGDRLRTADGRVEVLFADGSALRLDMRSTIDVQSDDLVRLTEGRLRLSIRGPLDGARGRSAATVAYRVDSPAGSVRITQPGEYRIALLRGTADTQLELAVVRGAAEIFTDEGSTPVRAGERAYASAGLAPSYAYAYNSASWDAFDRWSESRRDVGLGVSSQYLPSDMQAYAPLLDEGGDWRYTQSYGYAWYPRVSAEWRPYYNGRWSSYPRYGWTWIGADQFAWPTHHYGRWGYSTGVWFWIPSSRWAPAYVSWAYAPGYVSWCPLGFDDRAIIGLDLYRVGPEYYSPWRAWTAVSYSHFGSRDSYVNQRAINWERAGAQRPRFETRPSSPGVSRDVAVPRDATPIRAAGSRNLPPAVDGAQGRERDRVGISRGSDRPWVAQGNAAQPRDASSRDGAGLPPSGRPDAAIPRATAMPRYVNRGDEIVRSQTDQPTSRAAAPGRPSVDRAQGRPAEGYAIPRGSDIRTTPQGPARAARPEFERVQRTETTPVDGAQRRPFDAAQGRPVHEAYAMPRGAEGRTSPPEPARAGRPAFERVPRTEATPFDAAQGRPADGAQDRGRGLQSPYQPYQAPREIAPRAYQPVDQAQGRHPRPGTDAQPAPQRPPAAAPPEHAPSRGEARQPPPERAAPAEGAAPRETAAPRSGAAPPRRPGGGGS